MRGEGGREVVMIRIERRPEDISNQELCDIIHEAHMVNYDKGLIYGTSTISEDALRKKFCEGTACFVAFDEGQLVGMECVSVRQIDKWYHKGETAYLELIAVRPGNQGKGIASKLKDHCITYAKEIGLDTCLLVSAEDNVAIGKIYSSVGFLKVGYGAGASNNFYSVFYMKWIGKCPFSTWYVNFRFALDRLIHRLVFLPGGKLRFGLVKSL